LKAKLRSRIMPFVNGKPSVNGTPVAPFPISDVPRASPTPPDPPASDRDGAGRFRAGCRPGPGNPFAKRVASLRKALLESVGEVDVARLGKKLLDQALAGDVAAAKVLLSYLVGKPADAVDPDRVALEAWRIVLAWPTLAEVLATTGAVPPEAAAEVIRISASEDPTKWQGADRSTAEAALRVKRRREKEQGR
jgi:hypothetical protein